MMRERRTGGGKEGGGERERGTIGSNHKIGSSVRGTTRYGVKLCQRLTKWENSEIMGTWIWDTRGLLTMSI